MPCSGYLAPETHHMPTRNWCAPFPRGSGCFTSSKAEWPLSPHCLRGFLPLTLESVRSLLCPFFCSILLPGKETASSLLMWSPVMNKILSQHWFFRASVWVSFFPYLPGWTSPQQESGAAARLPAWAPHMPGSMRRNINLVGDFPEQRRPSKACCLHLFFFTPPFRSSYLEWTEENRSQRTVYASSPELWLRWKLICHPEHWCNQAYDRVRFWTIFISFGTAALPWPNFPSCLRFPSVE